MQLNQIVAGLLAVATTAAASPAAPLLSKRDPSDKSGSSKIAYNCVDMTLPNPGGAEGQGEGGELIATQNLSYFAPDGKQYGAKCKPDGVCADCTLSDGLPSEIKVRTCHFSIAGTCNIWFDYNGKHFDTTDKQPECGHEGGGFEPFKNEQTAICYFNL